MPSRNQIVRTLGEDGGAVCANPTGELNRAIRDGHSTNGAAGPGIRPVWTDRQLVEGERLVLSTYCPERLPYCPERLPAFLEYVESQEFDDTIRD